jgi:hypothetical protein
LDVINPQARPAQQNGTHPPALATTNPEGSAAARDANVLTGYLGRPSAPVFSATGPPPYDVVPNAIPDPLFASDQWGLHTLDDNIRVHELLGGWAEENRDALP